MLSYLEQTYPGNLEILLVWRSTVMPNEATREWELIDFRQALSDVGRRSVVVHMKPLFLL